MVVWDFFHQQYFPNRKHDLLILKHPWTYYKSIFVYSTGKDGDSLVMKCTAWQSRIANSCWWIWASSPRLLYLTIHNYNYTICDLPDVEFYVFGFDHAHCGSKWLQNQHNLAEIAPWTHLFCPFLPLISSCMLRCCLIPLSELLKLGVFEKLCGREKNDTMRLFRHCGTV